jgi:hypothetical protein
LLPKAAGYLKLLIQKKAFEVERLVCIIDQPAISKS